MVGIFDIDEKDRMIIKLLEEDPDISQNEIAKIVGLSQPSVGSRIKKLKDMGIISHSYGINVKNAGLYILKVDVKCREPKKILNKMSECPFFLNGFIVAGNKNLMILFAGEDLTTLEAIVDHHIRPDPEVYDVDVGIIVRAEKDSIIPLKLHVEKSKNASCNGKCSTCDFWRLNLCLGCPVTGHYRGKIWK
jgi:DNA-binding Lrp family transcriptional regulator